MSNREIAGLLQSAEAGGALSKEGIVRLLSITDPADMEALFQTARVVRSRVFQNKVFVYGFVYFSTYCHNGCQFCNFSRMSKLPRYRKSQAEIIDIARRLHESGVNLVDLTMGEDDHYYINGFGEILEAVRVIKKEMNLPVMISPGAVKDSVIDAFAEAGTDFFALYQETHNRELFAKLRKGQNYNVRMNAKLRAKEKGMLIEEGILTGVGETTEDIADSLLTMLQIGAAQMRVMSFIPHPGTPMETVKTPERQMELKIIALMRLLNPAALIPASLDVDGMDGLLVRMNAGASVITSIIPPKLGLSGVAQTGKELADGGRTVWEATEILKTVGLEPATKAEYISFIETLKAGGNPCLCK